MYCILIILAISGKELLLNGALQVVLLQKNPGNQGCLSKTITFVPTVSRYSSVFGISNMDLTPAQTTAMGFLLSSIRSALMSNA